MPHCRQFPNPEGLAAPHAEQKMGFNMEPHRVQYLDLSSFACSHEEHVIRMTHRQSARRSEVPESIAQSAFAS
jgi:hypothetical protein